MPRNQVEPNYRARAAAEHSGRAISDCFQQPPRVVAMYLDLLILGRSVEWAARIAARVIGDDRVVVGKETCDSLEDTGIGASTSDQELHRARTPRLLIESRSGEL
jgi:hypothetical protein